MIFFTKLLSRIRDDKHYLCNSKDYDVFYLIKHLVQYFLYIGIFFFVLFFDWFLLNDWFNFLIVVGLLILGYKTPNIGNWFGLKLGKIILGRDIDERKL
jgi:hypothetical protein